MKLVLEQNEIEAALEAFVRSQISVPDNQIITVRPNLGETGSLEASVFLNATSAPIPLKGPVYRGPLTGEAGEQPKAAATLRKPRGAKTEVTGPALAPHIAAQGNEDQATGEEAQSGTVVGITATPEDRQPVPLPVAAKTSIFAGLKAVNTGAPAAESSDSNSAEVDVSTLREELASGTPVDEAPAEPAPETATQPPKKSLFSFGKTA